MGVFLSLVHSRADVLHRSVVDLHSLTGRAVQEWPRPAAHLKWCTGRPAEENAEHIADTRTGRDSSAFSADARDHAPGTDMRRTLVDMGETRALLLRSPTRIRSSPRSPRRGVSREDVRDVLGDDPPAGQ